jgi:UDP-N-acetylmuramoylalanine--D-glutamate ligase
MVKLYVDKLGATRVTVLPFSIQHQLNNGAWKTGGSLVTSVEGKHDEIVATEDITIRGDHNLYNSMAATLAALVSDVRPASIRATLRNFKGVEHRLEFVREVNGVKYVNDSKATNVDSVWYALQSFKEPIVLLLGGRDKGNDYNKIMGLVKKHVKTIVAIGESADKVVSSFSGTLPVHTAGSMQDAVQVASSLAANGDVVLLSPACASFDWFENYEHRGRVFKEIISVL